MKDFANVKPGDFLRVVEENKKHDFKKGDIVKVLRGFGRYSICEKDHHVQIMDAEEVSNDLMDVDEIIRKANEINEKLKQVDNMPELEQPEISKIAGYSLINIGSPTCEGCAFDFGGECDCPTMRTYCGDNKIYVAQ